MYTYQLLWCGTAVAAIGRSAFAVVVCRCLLLVMLLCAYCRDW
jgi:hypothetical protein